MIDIAFVLLVVAVLLAVIALCQPLAAYLKLPPPVLLGVVGAALGGLPLALSTAGGLGRTDVLGDAFASLPISSAILINVFLPPLVFEAGIATDVRRVIEDAAPILLLAIAYALLSLFRDSPLARRAACRSGRIAADDAPVARPAHRLQRRAAVPDLWRAHHGID